MTYYEMMNEKRRSMSMQIQYFIRKNDGVIDEEIQKLIDEYKAVSIEATQAYADENKYGIGI